MDRIAAKKHHTDTNAWLNSTAASTADAPSTTIGTLLKPVSDANTASLPAHPWRVGHWARQPDSQRVVAVEEAELEVHWPARKSECRLRQGQQRAVPLSRSTRFSAWQERRSGRRPRLRGSLRTRRCEQLVKSH